jgi:uncharacterized coiled-coil DUF342 family protein
MVVNDRTVIDLQILGRNIVDLRAAVGRLEREVEALTLAYREVKGDIAGIDLQLRTMIGLADKRHADNLAEFGALHRELDTLRDKVAELHGEVAELRAGQQELRGEVGELRAGQQELRGEVAELRAGQQQLRGEVGELRAGQQELRGEVGELRAGQQELRGEVGELRAGQQATDRSIASLTAMIVKIHEKLGI